MSRTSSTTESPPVVHVVGAGLAGLACATRLALRRRRSSFQIAVHEATDHGGGRCRSYFDPEVGRTIDNGNHLLLSGNRAAHAYLREIGAADTTIEAAASFPFLDLRTGERWAVRPNRGPIPWWIFSKSRRIPGTRPGDYLAALRLLRAAPSATIEDVFGNLGAAYERFWKPLAVAVLNTPPEQAAARLLWPVVALTFGKGEAASRPCFMKDGLSTSLVDPAIAFLAARGAPVAFNRRLKALGTSGSAVTELHFADGGIPIGPRDSVVLAVPHWSAKELMPDLEAPQESTAIVNMHILLPEPPASAQGHAILGLVGGTAEWLFVRRDVASVTVSAATALATEDSEAIAARVWPEVARALGIPRQAETMPPHRVVKEKRATFAQTPASLSLRPGTVSAYANLFLAGDWTDTGLPATIEGAILSGQIAAEKVMARPGGTVAP